MNKVYTIGRDTSCDIVIPDSTDVVSRVHASLKVKGNGKYVLIDQSRNGTYVNGIKMSANEEIPVSRKDTISFAHIHDLDWNQIPKGKGPGMICIIAAIAVIAVACICYFTFRTDKESVHPVVEEKNIPAEIHEAPSVMDTIVKEPVNENKRPVAKPRPKEKKPEDKKKDDKPDHEEPEVVNPLL